MLVLHHALPYGAHVARRRYTDEQRAEALELYAEQGPTAVQAAMGIPKATVTNWAKAAGIGTVRNAKTAAATEARTLDLASRRVVLAEKLQTVAEVATERELQILATPFPELRDVVGARTRAIHDSQLLSGGATSRHEVITDAVDAEIAALTAELELQSVGSA